jgi:hypothetical protein
MDDPDLGETFNVGYGRSMMVKRLASEIIRLAGVIFPN